jgi:GNAT superfamily N-acetyltransferase
MSEPAAFHDSTNLDPAWVAGWLRARSVARELPAPVADHGGWRVDTELPNELRRYVFARPDDRLRALADTISAPFVFLKLCGSEQEMRPLMPAHWKVQLSGYMMTGEGFGAADHPLAPGYTLELITSSATTAARILTDDGALAASGFAAEADGFFVYDRIATDAEHRRLGLGSHLMQALRSARKSNAAIQILVATAEGQRLYSSLGWQIRSPYTTAQIPQTRFE